MSTPRSRHRRHPSGGGPWTTVGGEGRGGDGGCAGGGGGRGQSKGGEGKKKLMNGGESEQENGDTAEGVEAMRLEMEILRQRALILQRTSK